VLSGAEVAIVGCRPPGHLCGSERCRTDALVLTVSKQGRRVAKYRLFTLVIYCFCYYFRSLDAGKSEASIILRSAFGCCAS